MAYPQLRSMNASLHEGSTDGRYKKVRPDTECSIVDATPGTENLTYDLREDLNLQTYGIGEKRDQLIPGQAGKRSAMPDYYMNRLSSLSSDAQSSSW